MEPKKRKGALWATEEEPRGRLSMKVALAVALVIEVGVIVGISQLDFKKKLEMAEKHVMHVVKKEMPPPPPPPPPPPKEEPKPQEIKKIVEKIKDPTPPPPKPADPAPAAPPQIAVAQNASNTAPAVGTPGVTGPSTASPGITSPDAPPKKGPSGVTKAEVECHERAKPEYPRKALQAGASAVIKASLTIGKEGKVTNVVLKFLEISDGGLRSDFSRAVESAVRQYRCSPAEDSYIAETEVAFRLDE